MAKDKCIDLVEQALRKASVNPDQAANIIDNIKKTQREAKLENLDNTLKDQLANQVLKEQQIDKKIKERNAIENEIKIRKAVESVIVDFKGNEVEGLKAILVGSNLQKLGSRSSAALAQLSEFRQLSSSFYEKLRQNNLVELFSTANEDIDRRTSRTIWQLGEGAEVTEKNKDIVKLANIMSDYSEVVRKKLNNLGANIGKLPGWIVRQTHDPFQIRNAAKVLKELAGKQIDELDGSVDRNLKAWKEYIIPKLKDETFEGFTDKDAFLNNVYNSLSRNEHIITDGSAGSYGSRDITKTMNAKRVLLFKTADDWFDYNNKFGFGNLRESFFFGLQRSANNIGLITTLGTKPEQNFNTIKGLVAKHLVDTNRLTDEIKANERIFNYQLDEITGRGNMIGSFSGAKWSAITRSVANLAKLGGAVISSFTDVHTYASELKWQGRSYLGGVQEALTSLSKLSSTERKRAIAEQLGFLNDNLIHDLSSRYSTGDLLNKGFTKIQRTFFKLNLLRWWTDSLKEGSMLGLGNYVAKQRNIAFANLDEKFKRLITHFGIDEKIWNTIRKVAVETAEDGKEFFSVRNIDNLTNKEILPLMDIKNASQRQIDLFKDNLKTKVMGIFLDRSSYAVIEPDARTRAFMKQGQLAGTPTGEAIRFMGQFKSFIIAFTQKAVGRELALIKAGNTAQGVLGIANLFIGATIFGYISNTITDILKGKSPKNATDYKTWMAAAARGGGAGIYGDFLFQDTRGNAGILPTLAGPVISEAAKLFTILDYAKRGEGTAALRQTYKSVVGNTPFLNLFYTKTAFDYAIGYQIMETLSPGYLRRVERQMERDSEQEFLFTKPSSLFKGFR
jgi:hypothetical protein